MFIASLISCILVVVFLERAPAEGVPKTNSMARARTHPVEGARAERQDISIEGPRPGGPALSD